MTAEATKDPERSLAFSEALHLWSTLNIQNDDAHSGEPAFIAARDSCITHSSSATAPTSNPALGRFNRIWGFLGVPDDVEPPLVSNTNGALKRLPEAYASDGALPTRTLLEADDYSPDEDDAHDGENGTSPNEGDILHEAEGVSPVKNDAPNNANAALPSRETIPNGVNGVSPEKENTSNGAIHIANVPPQKPLTKAQRKKQRRRERRAEAERLKAFSDAELAARPNPPAAKASLHAVPKKVQKVDETPSCRYVLRSKASPKPATPKPKVKPDTPAKIKSETPAKIKPEAPAKAKTEAPAELEKRQVGGITGNAPHDAIQPTNSTKKPPQTPVRADPANRTESAITPLVDDSYISNHYVQKLSNIPLSATATPFVGKSHAKSTSIELTSSTKALIAVPGSENDPSFTAAEERHLRLWNKVLQEFPADRRWLVSPSQTWNHTAAPDGVHVFVDASNIFIGFLDFMKKKHNVPRWRGPRISFDALVLLMERRRPVAKRVLAGSLPHVPAFDAARAIGYELSILDKVHKAKELTERQKFFQQQQQQQVQTYRGSQHALNRNHHRHHFHTRSKPTNDHQHSPHSANDASSGSDSASAPPAKWVEQGVDEILHLKILESVVDAAVAAELSKTDDQHPQQQPPSSSPPTPPRLSCPTMVLATGDAAAAEYSPGFMAMAERALLKGWRVELVGWRANISNAYRRAEFREQWADRFRIVELDAFAEELMDG